MPLGTLGQVLDKIAVLGSNSVFESPVNWRGTICGREYLAAHSRGIEESPCAESQRVADSYRRTRSAAATGSPPRTRLNSSRNGWFEVMQCGRWMDNTRRTLSHRLKELRGGYGPHIQWSRPVAIALLRIRLRPAEKQIAYAADGMAVGCSVIAALERLFTGMSDMRPTEFTQSGHSGNCVGCGRVAPYRDATVVSSYRLPAARGPRAPAHR
jgi:hypothetical protein